QITTHDGADNSQRDIQPETLAGPVDNLGADEPSDQAKDDPTDDGHARAPFSVNAAADNSPRLARGNRLLLAGSRHTRFSKPETGTSSYMCGPNRKKSVFPVG